ncbi:MAG: hypothetical protein ACLR4A_11990 [Christensenellales bacterium]
MARLSKELPEDTLRQMHVFYEKLLRKYPDVVTVKDVVTLTGYTLTTVHNWCSRGSLKAFQKGLKFCIPKIFLVDFFLLPDLPLHHPQKPLAYPDAE